MVKENIVECWIKGNRKLQFLQVCMNLTAAFWCGFICSFGCIYIVPFKKFWFILAKSFSHMVLFDDSHNVAVVLLCLVLVHGLKYLTKEKKCYFSRHSLHYWLCDGWAGEAWKKIQSCSAVSLFISFQIFLISTVQLGSWWNLNFVHIFEMSYPFYWLPSLLMDWFRMVSWFLWLSFWAVLSAQLTVHHLAEYLYSLPEEPNSFSH